MNTQKKQIRKIKYMLAIFMPVIAMGGLMIGSTAYAVNDCDDVKTSVIDCTTANAGIWGLLLLVINILTAGIGIAAVAGIVYGSVLYTSAGSSPEQVKKAIGIITNVVIGLVAYALMYAFLNFIIPGGLFA
jgi:hypothetical protein